jgi:hypothetical protein
MFDVRILSIDPSVQAAGFNIESSNLLMSLENLEVLDTHLTMGSVAPRLGQDIVS